MFLSRVDELAGHHPQDHKSLYTVTVDNCASVCLIAFRYSQHGISRARMYDYRLSHFIGKQHGISEGRCERVVCQVDERRHWATGFDDAKETVFD